MAEWRVSDFWYTGTKAIEWAADPHAEILANHGDEVAALRFCGPREDVQWPGVWIGVEAAPRLCAAQLSE